MNKKNHISSGAYIHPTALIGPNVSIEDNVTVGPYCFLTGNVHISQGTHLYSHVTVGLPPQISHITAGLPPQNITTAKNYGSIKIGKMCQIREFVSIHASKYKDGATLIGNNCYIMTYSHIAHDVILEDDVVITSNSSLGGHVYIEKRVLIMANAGLHQFCRVGTFAAIAPYSGTRQDLPPFCLYDGQPVKFAGLNLVALKRAGFVSKNINSLKRVTKLFFQDKLLLEEIKNLAENKKTDWGQDELVQKFLTFIEKSERGVSRKTIDSNQIR